MLDAGLFLAPSAHVSGRRILHITTFLQGGAGRIVADLACVQRAQGHHVAVACAADEVDGYTHYPAWLEQLATAGVPLLPVHCTFRRSLYHLTGALSGLERTPFVQTGVDLMHAHAAVPALLAATLCQQVPVIATMHGWNSLKTPEHAATDVAIFNRVPSVVVPSPAAAAHLARAGVEAARVSVVPYGVTPQEAIGLSAADRMLLQRWRHAGLLLLACVGSVGERKRQALVLEAMASPRLRGRVACVFIGEGPDLTAHMDAARSRGLDTTTAFLGYRENVTDWLLASDGAVFPSQREGLPLALLETAALGVCPIASDIDEHRGVVTPGVSGLLFSTTSPHSLIAAVDQFLRMPVDHRRAMGEAARRVWMCAHQSSRMHDAYAALYASSWQISGRRVTGALAS